VISPIVTVYITNHNYSQYIKQAIDSVLGQTFQDFELIIIDDGSTDGSRNIIEEYEEHPKVKIVFQEKKGLTVSNNIAIKLAQGDYIVRLDADDYFMKDALKILIREFDDTNIGMVFGDWYQIDKAGEVIAVEQRHDFKNDVSLYDQPAHGACTMFRIRCLKKLNGYDESITRQDGYELWLRFIEHYEVKNISVPIFYYRQHNNSLSSDETQLLDTRAKILKKHAERNNNDQLKKKIFAIIPIRGSSIDSRSQPFIKLGNRYLIDYTLEVIERSSDINKAFVTTPSAEVIEYISNNYSNSKIIALKRPAVLARINSPINKTILNVIEKVKGIDKYKSFFVFSIETPFKRLELLESAISIMQIFNVSTVIGVRPSNQLFYTHNGRGLVPLQKENDFLRLEKNQLYGSVSGFLLRDLSDYLATNKTLGSSIGHVIIDQKASLQIQSELDIKIAESIIKD